MYVTLLEYLFVRVAFGLIVALFRAAGVVVSVVLWVLGAAVRCAVRPVARALARAIGRAIGHAELAAAARRRAGRAMRTARP